jgi:preprotein translocase subunit SecE
VSGVRVSPSVLKKNKLAGIRTYIEETINELTNKVSWPSWEDLQTSSIIVLTTSVILSLIIWLMDYAFGIWSVPEDEWGWRGILGFIYEYITP